MAPQENLKQVPFRLHENDYHVLKKLLSDDGLTFQSLVKVCVEAYLHGDQLMLRMLRSYKELSVVPKDVLSRYSLSQRERQALLEEIDREQGKEKIS